MMICSQDEKISLLEKTGLDHLVIIDFTPEFSRITSQSFVEDFLVGKLHARIIVVGFNHHFGYHRQGDFEYLYSLSRKYHFEVEEIPEQDIQNETVSSTRIRKAISEGNIQRANAYLDHYYTLCGTAIEHALQSALFGIPIFRLTPDENTKLIPPDGVYAVTFHCGNRQIRGMLSVQNLAVVNNLLSPETTIEFHPFEKAVIFEGEQIIVSFHKKIRDGISSACTEEIRNQLRKDISAVKELIF